MIDTYFNYTRRKSSEIIIGNTKMGGKNPILIQSMANSDTNNTCESLAQCRRISKAGCDLLRFTTQGLKEVDGLQKIHDVLRSENCNMPLVADVHFNPKVADAAAHIVEKVRINPGNYVDKLHDFRQINYTEAEYATEIAKIRERFIPFLDICRNHHTAIRIGVNHGSLSDRIMSRYGDTPHGMVESCMEFLRLCKETDFKNVAVSIKSSNTIIMIQTIRLLSLAMEKEGMDFPIHLGVTEAGNGEDGRIKSAVGIGTLLLDGIGDTLRVSLTESPENEIPVARKLINLLNVRIADKNILQQPFAKFDAFKYQRRETESLPHIGGTQPPIVVSNNTVDTKNTTISQPDFIYAGNTIINSDIPQIIEAEIWTGQPNCFPVFHDKTYAEKRITTNDMFFLDNQFLYTDKAIFSFLKKYKKCVPLYPLKSIGQARAFFHQMQKNDCRNPVVIVHTSDTTDLETLQLSAGMFAGSLFVDGFGNGIFLRNNHIPTIQLLSTSFGLLQATRTRISRTEYVACPGCGRTMFDLQTTLESIKQATAHLKNLKIAVMGCIVNGTGEMSDADYGYVGAGKGRISLYKQKTCVLKNIPEAEAVEQLLNLICKNGDG